MTIKWLKSKAIFAHLDNICLLHNLFEERNFSITRKFGKVVPEKTLKKKKQNETKTSEIGSVNILASFYVAFWVSIIIRACVMKENRRTWMIYQGLSSHISDRYRNGGPEQLTNFRAHRASSSRARGRGRAGPCVCLPRLSHACFSRSASGLSIPLCPCRLCHRFHVPISVSSRLSSSVMLLMICKSPSAVLHALQKVTQKY